MRILTLLCLISLSLAGCAVTPPPAPTSVSAKPAAAGTHPQDVAVQQPVVFKRPRATGTLEDARRHMLRGMAAIEMAKSNEDLTLAEDEFRMATEIAPQMGIAWFNMGKAQTQLGRYTDAISSFRQYLSVAPEAEDARRVRDEIIKLEFRQEQVAKSQARVGSWVGQDGTPYNLTLEGNRLTLKTSRRRVSEEEVRSTYPLVGSVPITVFIQAEFRLALQGNHLTGTWNRGAVRADKCMVPPDTSEVSGELNDGERKMVLKHARTAYAAATQMSLLSDDYCAGVTAKERKTIELTLYGPLPKGGLGVGLGGLVDWWDGGFSAIQFGWQGRLRIYGVEPGTPAYEAGLRNQDEILAIDGVAVKSLSAGEAVMRVRGEPGSSVTLEVWRKAAKDPFLVTVRRVEVPPAPAENAAASWIN